MSLIDNSDNLSIGPLLVLTTVPVGAGPFGRGPLVPFVAGSPPTRNGSLSIESARPSTIVEHDATVSTAARQATAARATRRLRPRLFICQPHSRPAVSENPHSKGDVCSWGPLRHDSCPR